MILIALTFNSCNRDPNSLAKQHSNTSSKTGTYIDKKGEKGNRSNNTSQTGTTPLKSNNSELIEKKNNEERNTESKELSPAEYSGVILGLYDQWSDDKSDENKAALNTTISVADRKGILNNLTEAAQLAIATFSSYIERRPKDRELSQEEENGANSVKNYSEIIEDLYRSWAESNDNDMYQKLVDSITEAKNANAILSAEAVKAVKTVGYISQTKSNMNQTKSDMNQIKNDKESALLLKRISDPGNNGNYGGLVQYISHMRSKYNSNPDGFKVEDFTIPTIHKVVKDKEYALLKVHKNWHSKSAKAVVQWILIEEKELTQDKLIEIFKA